jgi:hypothetical protein
MSKQILTVPIDPRDLQEAGRKPKRDLSKTVMGRCLDCGKPCLLRDDYIVRSEVWASAVPGGWASGYLHRQCLERRQGRALTEDDLLAWVDQGAFQCTPEYVQSLGCTPK